MFGEWICRTMEWLTKESFYTYNQVPKYEKIDRRAQTNNVLLQLRKEARVVRLAGPC